MNKVPALTIGALIISSLVASATAETIDFGGRPERFKGKGDRVPPTCQVQSPNAAAVPFFIVWNCEDDDTSQPDIRTELWALKKGAVAWELALPVLGFPAAFNVTGEFLKSTTVKEGLPASFRLVGIDRAGNATISSAFTVAPGDSEPLSCNLTLTADGTETSETGDTTGVPARSVVAPNAPSEFITSSPTSFSVSGSSAAETCEIDSVCENESKVEFAGTGIINSGSSADVQLTIAPGSVSSSLTGPVTKDSSGVINGASLTGTAVVEDANVSIQLSCGSGETASDETDFDGGTDTSGDSESTDESVTEATSADSEILE